MGLHALQLIYVTTVAHINFCFIVYHYYLYWIVFEKGAACQTRHENMCECLYWWLVKQLSKRKHQLNNIIEE